MRLTFLRVAGLVAGLAAATTRPAAAHAQVTITLEGTVLGEKSQPIASAVVLAENLDTDEQRHATTNAAGGYRILGLSPGRYGVTVRAIGYRPTMEKVQLIIGQRAQVDFHLEQATRELASVTVVGTTVKQVEVQRLSISAPVVREEIENLPLNQRGILNLASIAPGIKSYAPQQGRSLPSAGAAPADGSVRPCCGAYAFTPGAIDARLRMPRWLSGRFSISWRTTGAEIDMRCTSTCFTFSPTTLTAASSVEPFSSAKSSFARWPRTSCTTSLPGL